MWDPILPSGPSWDVAAGALAMDTEAGSETVEQLLLELAIKDAGDPVLLAGEFGVGVHVVVAPVLWQSAPWLGRARCDGYDTDVFLFATAEKAVEWAGLWISEVAQQYSELGEVLPHWTVSGVANA